MFYNLCNSEIKHFSNANIEPKHHFRTQRLRLNTIFKCKERSVIILLLDAKIEIKHYFQEIKHYFRMQR